MWGTLGLLLGTSVFLFYLVKLYLTRNKNYWKDKGVLQLKNDLTFLELATAKKSPMDCDFGYYKQIGNEAFGGALELGSPILVLKDLDLVKNICVKDFEYFIDRRPFSSNENIFSDSVLFMKGQEWKNMRSFLSPTFSSGKIRRMFEQFDKSGEKLIQYVKAQYSKTSKGYNVKIGDVIRRYTVDVIGSTAFGMDTKALEDPNSEFLKMATRSSDLGTIRLIRTVIMVNFPRLGEFLNLQILEQEVTNFFRGNLISVARARESSKEKRNDFLQLLLEAKSGELKKDEENELYFMEKEAQLNPNPNEDKKQKVEMTENKLLAQAFLFFFAGFDTVTGLLQNALYVFAAYPEIQERVFNEIEQSIETTNGKITYDSINKMEYLDMVLAEITRRYTPATRLERQCVKDYKIPETNVELAKGTIVIIPAESIHMDERYYPDPETFDPERFTTENKAKRSPYSYLAFGIGPRNCIGVRFALIETKTAVAHMVHTFKLEANEKTQLPIKMENKMGSNRAPKDLEIRFVPRK